MIRKKYNPLASANNTLVIANEDSGCCGNDATVCNYSATVSATVTSIKILDYTGAEKTITISAYSGVATLERQIAAALEANGYVIDGGLSVLIDGSNVTISLTGEAKLVAVNATNSTTKCCKSVLCDYVATFPASATAIPFSWNGTVTNITRTTVTAASAVKTAVETAATGETSVTVAKDGLTNDFTVTIRSKNSEIVLWDGAEAHRQNCGAEWVVCS